MELGIIILILFYVLNFLYCYTTRKLYCYIVMSSKLTSHWHIKICHVSFGLQDKDKFPIQNLWVIIFIKINKKIKKIKINFLFKIGR